ncbi:cysteine-rich receptor-like protein kinase 6 [Dendrobium catenatum]|uniref:cysteine-rich receptor-like protein kinase 6 n=1 Tax=Dendrobium catenatum TaxID=906689 RepID=UPI0010A05B3D|nr:cysteine-rich receptor-like protein kinase 6 [Dendrobium catenatum]
MLAATVEFSKTNLQGERGGRVLGMWCNIRYELYKFYDGTAMLQLSSDQSPSSPLPTNALMSNVTHPPADLSHGGSNTVRTIMSITLSLLVVLVLLTVACLYFRRRRSKMKIPREDIPEQLINVESLFFDLSTLELATSNFSEHNKLGEGGFGSVYLGLLPDGREIAVKRLSTRSRQGINDLRNEMILIAKLQHKNLVRLHGVCLEDQEKLLVYEYVPNKSLDTILFDPIKSKLLDWEKRYEIIEGIVRKLLLYLHEDSQLKIIHRDLKASNILLDADMNSKISDFGLARLFGVDETHEMTSCVVGT